MGAEAAIERAFARQARDRGWRAIKLEPGADNRGVPDRLVLFPGGRAALIEFKAPGGKLSLLQARWQGWLSGAGIPATVAYSADEAIKFCEGVLCSA